MVPAELATGGKGGEIYELDVMVQLKTDKCNLDC